MLRTIVHTLSHAAAERLRHTIARALRRPAKLRVGVDIRSLYEPLTGIGWYVYHLLHEMAKSDDVELYLFGDARTTDIGPTLHADVPPNAHVCWFDARGRGRISRIDRALTAAAYVLWMKIVDVDVMFAPNYFLPRLLAAVARRRVITIHDLTYKRFPELLQAETLQNLERHMAREIALANAVICVSESTRRDLLDFYEVDPRRAITIHSGVAPHPASGHLFPASGEKDDKVSYVAPRPAERGEGGRRPGEGPPLPKRYILFVSTIEPRKNLEVLLDAFERLRARGAYDGSLVVAGRIGWKSERIAKRLQKPGIVHLDYLSAPDLAAAYRGAEMFVFPSLYEGFGFPLLEAMSHGIPTIAARSSSLPEIGGDAALYFDPSSARELEAQIERLISDPALRQDLIARGQTRAAGFRWSDAAAKTLEVFRSVA